MGWQATLHEGRIRCNLGRFVRAVHLSAVLCVGTRHHVQTSNCDCPSQISCRNQVLLSVLWVPSGRACRLIRACDPRQRLHLTHTHTLAEYCFASKGGTSSRRLAQTTLCFFVCRFGVKKKLYFVCKQRHAPVMIQMCSSEFDALLLLLGKEERLLLRTKWLQSLCYEILFDSPACEYHWGSSRTAMLSCVLGFLTTTTHNLCVRTRLLS